MNCQNNFCIYWDNRKCILDEISLNICGQCEECVLIEIDEELLKKQRKIILDRLD